MPTVRRRNPAVPRDDLDITVTLRAGEALRVELRPNHPFRMDGLTIEDDISGVYLVQMWVGLQHQLLAPLPLMTMDNMTCPALEVGNNLSFLFANYSAEEVTFKMAAQGREVA